MQTPTRREFLGLTLAAGAAVATGGLGAFPRAARAQGGDGATGKRILILGGTGFLGPATVEAALQRGHSLTLFNRGLTEKRTGHTFEDDPRIERLHGDRDPNRGEGDSKGLTALERAIKDGRRWDAVIDNSGYYPRVVRASAELTRPAADQYIFISSISAYAKNDQPGADEDSELATMDDPAREEMGEQFQFYGPLKVLCEKAAQDLYRDRATVVRPGYIVGPGDPTPRFTYWPVRVARGGETLAAGAPDDPVQVIDVRDLGEWLIRLVETSTAGVFNATGPAEKLTVGETLEACRKTSGSDATFAYAPMSFLEEHQVSLPIFIPPVGEYKGFHQYDVSRAVKAGLTFRPITETTRDTLAWFNNELAPERRERLLGMFLAPEREAELLAQLKAAQGR